MCPGRVQLSFDMRHPNDQSLADMAAEIQEQAYLIAKDSDSTDSECRIRWTVDSTSPAVAFSPDCIRIVTEAAQATVGRDSMLEMASGAGHDR